MRSWIEESIIVYFVRKHCYIYIMEIVTVSCKVGCLVVEQIVTNLC
jgi:hypothetical protein